jgi:antitoxin PrlF
MRVNVIVSPRGQITLPAQLRRRLGIQPGGVLMLEESEGRVVLQSAATVEYEVYSDEDIARWDAEDELSPEERAQLSRYLGL